MHEGKAGNSIERTFQLPLRILESTGIRPFPSIGPSPDATAKFLAGMYFSMRGPLIWLPDRNSIFTSYDGGASLIDGDPLDLVGPGW
jgi:hypothetical protein